MENATTPAANPGGAGARVLREVIRTPAFLEIGAVVAPLLGE